MGKVNRRQVIRNLAIGVSGLPCVRVLARENGAARLNSNGPAGTGSVPKLVAPGVWRTTLGNPETLTPVGLRQFPPALDGFRKLPSVSVPPLSPRGELSRRGYALHIPLAADEKVYGLGLQLLSHQQRGKKKTLRVNADPPKDSGDTHAPVPFVVTTRGYGILIDTARYATFYVDNIAPNRDGSVTESGSEIVVEVPRASGADVYLFAGPSMREAVQRYNLFSGGGCLPPEWGLGFWYRASGGADQMRILALAKKFRERQIPCDVIGLEPGWQSHAYSCTYTWSKERFPQPGALIHELDGMAFKINLWEHAFTHPDSPLHGPLQKHSGDTLVFDGLVPDFVGSAAREIFGDYHKEKLVDLGVSGFKLDECDNSDFVGGWSFPELSQFPSGVDGEQMHCLLGLRYQDAVLHAFRKAGRETYGLVRSSGALAAPYPFVVYSDLYDHRSFVRALVNSGFSGLLWCPEVRDAESSEDLIRRLQSVVFSPLAMINAWYIENPPWMQQDKDKNNRGEFAPGWEDLERHCKEIIGWRMQLVPYLMAAFERYRAEGIPPFRALVLDHPDDALVFEVDDQYLVGDRMLVAPVFAGEARRKVTLPQGIWCDFWTGESIKGGTVREVETRFDRIPVYVKSGSIIPLGGPGVSAKDPARLQLTARVYGDGAIPFSLSRAPGLHLSWNATTKQGTVRQLSDSDSRYSIAHWQEMGS